MLSELKHQKLISKCIPSEANFKLYTMFRRANDWPYRDKNRIMEKLKFLTILD